MADKGKTLGRAPDGQILLVDDAVPGDIVTVRVLRKKKGLKWGVAETISQLSPHRVEPRCQHFELCGGCKWQHLDYNEQLRQKDRIVKDAFTRIAKIDVQQWEPILGADPLFYYRNKMEYTFSRNRWLTYEEINSDQEITNREAVGLHRPGAYNKIIDIKECLLQDPKGDQIRNGIKSYAKEHGISLFDIDKHEGALRTLMMRNTTLGEFMVTVVFYTLDQERIIKLLDHLTATYPFITSLYYVINQKKNDSLSDQNFIHYAGETHIREQLDQITYVISPNSFFQTNSYQAKNLYDQIKLFSTLSKDSTVYDLYSGTGSIGLYLADQCREVIGIEEIDAAVKDARINATQNSITNAHFYTGDVRYVLNKELLDKHGAPDTIILDPPRAGIHEEALQFILSIGAPQIVYVSCNPATQARDVKLLSELYDAVKSRAVDMFPHTNHIENVLLLTKKEVIA
ncbi:UNVERIFIED_CONTAM: hypothetical protein GTU68_030975 [Idotea baltica]|nr:hypothetical protein [Idotea baltica]